MRKDIAVRNEAKRMRLLIAKKAESVKTAATSVYLSKNDTTKAKNMTLHMSNRKVERLKEMSRKRKTVFILKKAIRE